MWKDTFSGIFKGMAVCSVLGIAAISGLIALAYLTQ